MSIIAEVFFVIFFKISLDSVFQVYKLQSTKIGLRSHFITHKAVDIIEKDGIITSEFFFKFKDFKATSRAAVPLETAMPYFLELNLENFFSNSLTNFPSEDIQFVFKHLITFCFSFLYNFGTFTGINLKFLDFFKI